MDENALLFPGASKEQRLAISQAMGMIIGACIYEMEESLIRLRKECWEDYHRDMPVSPEFEELGDQFFGEGLTVLKDKIYQLTWQKKTGFIYDLATMEQTGTFVYGSSAQGWGLCNDGEILYKSDGTEKIWTLNPSTLAEQDYIEIYTHQSKIKNVNELEWVDGKIYANIYQKDAIAIVDPASGAVEGVINLKGLQDQVTQHQELDVLNGIAYKGEPGILYVTGKNWDKLFKIRIVEN